MRPHNPSFGHRASTFFFVSRSILISSGQGRVKPSLGHLRVKSTPILSRSAVARDPFRRQQ